MEYKDIQEKLSILRTVTMAPEQGQKIEQVLQTEIQKYRTQGHRRNHARRFGWAGSVAAAIVVCAIGVGAVVHIQQLGQTSKYTTASHGPSTTVPIRYKTAQLTQIKQVASAVGVTPMIPAQGQSGDTLTIVKNGGKGNLILDYKTFWIIESASPISGPVGIPTRKTISWGSTTATYWSNAMNSFLYFEDNGTYFAIQNLKVGVPISEQNLKSIAASLQPVQ